jgi:ubiquinone/menaquinone biosynthesis C-methylase UbiE
MKVSGSDISEILIKDLNTHFPEIRTTIGSYDEIKCEIEKYDVVYCFRSTWYFSDIFKALDVMFNMSKNGGSVVFDIMNSDSLFNRMIILKHRFLLPYNFVKNIVKLALNLVLGKKYLMQDLWNIHEIPVSVYQVEKYLINRGIKFKIYSISELESGRSASIANPKASSKVLFDCIAN